MDQPAAAVAIRGTWSAAMPSGAARARAYWSEGGQTSGEQLGWKRALAERHRRPGPVLDAGCGDGASSPAGACGFDGAEAALREAARRGVRPFVADLERSWPVRDGGVGTVLLFDVLEHVPDPRSLLAEARRVLRSDGLLLAAIPNAAHVVNRLEAVRGRTSDFTDAAHHHGGVVSDHLHRFTLAAAEQLLEEAGFQVLEAVDFFPSRFTEGAWGRLGRLAALVRRSGAVSRWPALLVYERCWVCRRVATAGAARAPTVAPARTTADAGRDAGRRDAAAVRAGAGPPPLPRPAARPGEVPDAIAGWGRDDPRYRGYLPTRRGVRLDHRVRVALDLLARDVTGAPRLVDVGGGDGWIAAAAGARVGARDVAVVDLASPSPLAALARPVRRIVADVGGALPLPDGEADVVLCLEVLEHVLDPDRLLDELHRVLRPGGTLVLSTPRLDSGLVIVALLAGVQPPGVDASRRRQYGSPMGEGRPSGHLHLFSRRALREALHAHAFEVQAWREARFSSSWRQARRASRRLAPRDVILDAAFSLYDLIPVRKDVSVVRAVRSP